MIRDKDGNVVSKLVKFNKFVTVKKVYIKNRYEYGDVGKIIAIDTIGLGNAYSIEEDTKKMQDVLANEADIAVYNFKVNSSGCSTFPNEIKDELNEIYDVLSEYHSILIDPQKPIFLSPMISYVRMYYKMLRLITTVKAESHWSWVRVVMPKTRMKSETILSFLF